MKTRILINARRNGYSPEQCGRTMTVGELMNFLDGFDEEAEIFLSHDNGYTFGELREGDLNEDEKEEEEDEDDNSDDETEKS